MAEVCFNVPEGLKDKLSRLSDLAFAKMLEKAIEFEERKVALEELEELTKDSEFSEEDAIRLGEQVKEDRLRELKKRGIL